MYKPNVENLEKYLSEKWKNTATSKRVKCGE